MRFRPMGLLPCFRSCRIDVQVLLDSVRQEIPQSPHLGPRFPAHQDRLVPPLEERSAPAVPLRRLLRELRQEVAHEAGQRLRILRGDQKVEMAR